MPCGFHDRQFSGVTVVILARSVDCIRIGRSARSILDFRLEIGDCRKRFRAGAIACYAAEGIDLANITDR
ncbi:MAG: hypothetical protein HC942_18435 [Microcoleus sp. SU_5_6]|nr:hypothetical protein [Microcoleus sp. SU_5_6]